MDARMQEAVQNVARKARIAADIAKAQRQRDAAAAAGRAKRAV